MQVDPDVGQRLAHFLVHGDLDTALDIVLYYTDQPGKPPDWFSVNRDFQRMFGLDNQTSRLLITYIRHNKDILYDKR